MKPRPLTLRKPALPAALASTAVSILVLMIGIAVHFVLLPPLAWLPAGDEPHTADIGFFLHIVGTPVDQVLTRHDFWMRIDGLMKLPQTIIDTVVHFDLTASLVIRVSAIGLAALYAGMEAHRIVLSRAMGQLAVRHINGPRLLSGRAARLSLLAAWHRRYGAD